MGSGITFNHEPGKKYELQYCPEQLSGATALDRLLSVKNAGKYHQKSAVAVMLKNLVFTTDVFKGGSPALSTGN